MEKCGILRYGEISLRGKNRRMYEDFLENNVRKMLSMHNVTAKIKRYKGRMVVITNADVSFLKRIFGISSFSLGYRALRDFKEINKAISEFGSPSPIIKFADKGKRDEKLIEQIIIGTEGKVFVEIYPDNVFVYDQKEKAVGGLPIGSEGVVICYIEDEMDILASLLMMKRGCEVIPFLKNKIDISLFKKYGNYNEPVKYPNYKDAIAIVSRKKENSILPRLNPLIGINKEKNKELLAYYESL